MSLILPSAGYDSIPNDVVIEGSDFGQGAVAELQRGGVSTRLLDVVRLSATQLLALVPRQLDPGQYDVVVRNPDGRGEGRLAGGYTVLLRASDDLAVEGRDIWTDPVTLRREGVVRLGVNVQRRGGSATLSGIPVEFWLGERRASNSSLIGVAQSGPVPPAPPGSGSTALSIEWQTGGLIGTQRIFVYVDPDNTVPEVTKGNNHAVRVLTILPTARDSTPPEVRDLRLNGGAAHTTSRDIQVEIVGFDPAPVGGAVATGVRSMLLNEVEFNSAAGEWVGIGTTGWVPFSATSIYRLTDRAGQRQIHAYIADGEGNISTRLVRRSISYEPASDTLRQGQIRVYRRTLTAGESLTAVITPRSGDPDLYVWGPDSRLMALSDNFGPTVDQATIVATSAGVYQVEVHAYEDTIYQIALTTAPTDGLQAAADRRPVAQANKTPPTAPIIPPTSDGGDNEPVPTAPIGDSGTDATPTPTLTPVAPTSTATATDGATVVPTTTATGTNTPAATSTDTATPSPSGSPALSGSRVYLPVVTRSRVGGW